MFATGLDLLRAQTDKELRRRALGDVMQIPSVPFDEIQDREGFMRRSADKRKADYVEQFKEYYTKLRIDNIVLSHENAIELVKATLADAATITWEDTQ